MKALKCLVVFAVVAGLCTTVLAVEPPQSSLKAEAENPQVTPTDPPGPPTFFSDACPATNVGMLASDGSVLISGDTCGSANDYENDGYDCSYGAGGQDQIYEFTVDATGYWQIDTMNICAGWDTSLMVREETGGGCPGDFLDCDGDSGHGYCGSYESAVSTFLAAGTTYYLVVDGWSPFTCGTFDVVSFLVQAACTSDLDCDDTLFCNGAETCNVGTGECVASTPPCAYYQTCDEVNDICIDPDPCISWQGGARGSYFFPYVNHTPGAWLLDDIELERACTDTPAVLNWYDVPIIARGIQNPIGTTYFMTLGLWEVEEGTCMPLALIAGSDCVGLTDDIDAGGSPSDIFHCPAAGVVLPDNSGDFMRCEIDFFAGYMGNDLGVGFGIAASEQIIGGVGAADDFGVNVFFLEDFAGAGTFYASWFGDDAGLPADMENLLVCTDNVGVCCEAPDVCIEDVLEADCAGDWFPCLFYDPPACEDPDGDGVFTICGDNCPGVANPGQEDCDGGMTPEGDVCETDWDYGDDDGDGECNGTDGCPNDPNKIAPGICGCGNSDVDTDGDGLADCLDECPLDPNKVVPGQCGCGVPDTDDDGDGVANCNDACPGVDDAIFAPGCLGAIPTVSEWGLVILALLLLVGAKVYFGRRAAMS